MDRVLGLSMTSNVVRWVLVDGATGDGAAADRGALDIADVEAFDAEALLETLLEAGDPHTVGLTWSPEAEAAAIKVRAALAVLGGGAQLVAVSDVEATEVLARGLADIGGYGFLAVCTVEPDTTVVATVNSQPAVTERIDSTNAVPLIDQVNAVVHGVRPSPDAVFVLGSGDADALASALRDATTRPVLTAAESEFALARGAALAAARALTIPEAPVVKPRISQAGVASSVLAAAAVAFVVSLTLAVVPHRGPASTEQPHHATAHTARPAAPPSTAHAAPPAPADVPPDAPPSMAQPLAEPVYVPAAPPPPPQPRLRDRIIEKIPRLNGFH